MNTEHSTAFSNGCYVATSISSGMQIGYDSFEVHRAGDNNILIESKHMFHGLPRPFQVSRFRLDSNWIPSRLEVEGEQGASAVVEFGETTTAVAIYDPGAGEQRMSFPIGRHRAYFLLSGGLYLPLLFARRFRFDEPQPQHFDIVPEGVCQVSLGESYVEDGEVRHQLEARMMVSGIEDVIYMVLNDNRDLIRYRSRNQNLLVKLERGE